METAFVRSGPVQNYPALVSGVSLILMTIIASISYLNQTLEPFFAVVLLDFIVSASIYFCFKDESPRLAMWSSALRAIYSTFLLVIVGINLGDWQNFDRSFTLILGFFGFHLGVQAWIFLRLKTLRYLMAFLLFISGLGYIFDSLLMAFQWTGVSPVAEYTFVGEIVMTFWFIFIAFKREFPLK